MKIKFILLLIIFSGLVHAQFVKLYDLNGPNGMNPQGDLYSDGTYLYGMTRIGGSGGSYGTIFKINQEGSGMSVLYNFGSAPSDPKLPWGSLCTDGTNFFGMTYRGGTHDMGAVFKIPKTGSSSLTTLKSFSPTTGSYPSGSLIMDGTNLFGVADEGGGGNAFGLVFNIKTDGTLYTKLYTFSVTTDGKTPTGVLYDDGSTLYGAAAGGGLNDKGTLYKIKKDGTGFTKLLDFNGAVNGSVPRSLISDGTYLYGMTSFGGSNDSGVVYKVLKDGSGFEKLHDFSGLENGSLPTSKLVFDGTYLYGMTSSGGVYNKGIIFKLKTDGTDFTKMLDFTDVFTGASPYGSLILEGNTLYGMTRFGGAYNGGTIFKIDVNTTTVGIERNKLNLGIDVYPNPSNGIINLKLDLVSEVMITNAIGQLVYASKLVSGMHQINLENLASGVYIMKVSNIQSSKNIKLIKE